MSANHTTIGVIVLACLLLNGPPATADAPQIPRDFDFTLPLFSGPWLEDASSAAVHPDSDAHMLRMYKVVCGDATGLNGTSPIVFPFADVAYDEWTIPIYRAGSGQQSVTLCDYEGVLEWPNEKWGVATEGGPVTVPSCATDVRPSNPVGSESDGHLVLYDPSTFTEYDFWQATTARSAPCASLGGGQTGPSILEAGYPDFFDVRGDGSNPRGVFSARAMGTALLAGMILPEDVESGSIDHALALGMLGPRNLSLDPQSPLDSDVIYPAATTESDMYSSAPYALVAGQRIRAKQTLVDENGVTIDEATQLAPITRMFFQALRSYGAYVVDNAGGFSFYAEEIRSADLNLSDADVNGLIGEPPGTPIPAGLTKWELVIQTLNEDLWDISIPIAYGTCNGANSVITTANYEVVSNASTGGIFSDGFESSNLDNWSSAASGTAR